MIHVATTPAEVDPVYFPQIEVIGDIGPSLAMMADRLEGQLRTPIALLPLRAEILASITDRADDARFPPRRSASSTSARGDAGRRHHLPRQRRLQDLVRAQLPHPRANTVLLDNALATMGAGLPSAMMAAMLYPDRKVMAICGDGGFMMNSQEMETAVRLRLNLTVLILRDDAYGMIRWKQAATGFADFGLTFGNPDFVNYAEAYGAQGARVERDRAIWRRR